MNCPRVAITGLGLWTTGFPSAAAWAQGVADPAVVKPLGLALDKVNRRRAGPLARALADATAAAMVMAEVDATAVPTVVGSALGEALTMTGLLDAMWRHNLPMSPAEFTVSVHNAASGLISIANKNRGMTTSLAADEDTPAAALLEAIGLVMTRGVPAVVACADEPAPEALVQHAPQWAMLAASVVLAPYVSGQPCLGTLRIVAGEAPTLAPRDCGELLRNNPQVGLLWLIDAVQRGCRGRLRLDVGTGRGFCAELEPGGA